MSSNSTSPVSTESNGSSLSSIFMTACDDQTCSTAKCALCLHCSQQYCLVHFLKHNEQLSLNAHNFTLTIDQLEDQIRNLKLDEYLRRTIHSLDQWRKNLLRTIEYVYQDKLSSIKANYIQLSNYLQEFQFEQTSHIQALRIDLEQMKFIRSTYNEEMNKIQMTIKNLQTNLSELQYDLHLKENQTLNISDSIECEMLWKRSQTDGTQTSTTVDASEDDQEELHEYSTPSPPASYEHSLLSFLIRNQSPTNKDDKLLSSNKNKPTIILTNINKKRRICMNCGKCYHPSSLQRHYRQCKHQSALRDLNQSNSKSFDQTTLKSVTNTIRH